MLHLAFVAHIVFIWILAIWAFNASLYYKIAVTIHNLPIILLAGLFLYVAIWIMMFCPILFFAIGFTVGFAIFVINSVKIPNQTNPILMKKIFMSLLCFAFWPELIIFIWFVVTYSKKDK